MVKSTVLWKASPDVFQNFKKCPSPKSVKVEKTTMRLYNKSKFYLLKFYNFIINTTPHNLSCISYSNIHSLKFKIIYILCK